MSEEPRYPHKCSKCIFLGRYISMDVYIHREKDVYKKLTIISQKKNSKGEHLRYWATVRDTGLGWKIVKKSKQGISGTFSGALTLFKNYIKKFAGALSRLDA